jgi:PAS domain S-box-containing protein
VDDDQGTLLGLSGVVQDITERKRAETARLEAAEKLRVATAAARLGIYTWDRKNDRSDWENDRMYEITGRRREEGPLNRAEFLRTLIHPDDVAEFERTMREAVARGDEYRSECRIRRADGQTRWVEFSGKFDVGPDGLPTRLIGVMADITDRVEARREGRFPQAE